MKISVAKREYLTEIEVRKFTLKTIKSYRNNLNLFLHFCEDDAGVPERVESSFLSLLTATIKKLVSYHFCSLCFSRQSTTMVVYRSR